MNEANVLMPRLVDFGMHYGHPLCVLQDKLKYVSKMYREIHKQGTLTIR